MRVCMFKRRNQPFRSLDPTNLTNLLFAIFFLKFFHVLVLCPPLVFLHYVTLTGSLCALVGPLPEGAAWGASALGWRPCCPPPLGLGLLRFVVAAGRRNALECMMPDLSLGQALSL